MSIDREIALRERLYGNNPQGLMQRYGMTQDTLDLLALMKVKKEQEAAKRQLQASMQQQPGTVKEQAEQQLIAEARSQMGAGMNDRVQQVGGAMRQQQAQQAQAMQRLAQAAQRPTSNPMMSGIARVPAPNMRMAQGGVVGYANGDLIETRNESLKELIRKALALGASRADLQNLVSRSGVTLEELGFTAPQTSEDAPGIGDSMRFAERSPEAMSEAVNAVPMASRNVPLPTSMEEQITQALAQRPDVAIPRASSLMAPSTQTRDLSEALGGSPAEQRALLAREIDRQIEELGGSQRGRIGSTRALPQEAQERIARVNELERDKLRLLAAGRDPEKIQATVDAIAGRMPYSARPVGDFAERALPAGREGRSSEDIASMLDAAMRVQQAPQLTPTLEQIAPGGAGASASQSVNELASQLVDQDAQLEQQNVNAPATSTTSSGGFFSPSGPGSALAGGTTKGSSAGSTAGASGAVAPGAITRGPLAGLPQLTANTDLAQDPRVVAATNRLRSREAAQAAAYGTPKVERTAARDEVDQYLRRTEFENAERARIEALKAAQAQTPEELAAERRRAFLLGGSGRSRGFAASGASAGLANILAAQRARKIGDLEKRQEMERGLEARDITIGKEGISAGKTAEEQAALGLRGLTSAASDEQVAVINTAADMAKLKFQRDEANQAAYIQAAEAAYKSAQDALTNATNNLERLQAERDSMDRQVKDIRDGLFGSVEFSRFQNELETGRPVVINGNEVTSVAELIAIYNKMAVELANNIAGGGTRFQDTRAAIDQAVGRLMGNIGVPTAGLPSAVSVTPSGR